MENGKEKCDILKSFFETLNNFSRNESKPAREETKNDLSVYQFPLDLRYLHTMNNMRGTSLFKVRSLITLNNIKSLNKPTLDPPLCKLHHFLNVDMWFMPSVKFS